jgi:hypothetical protein
MADSGRNRPDPSPVQNHDDDRFQWKTSTVSTLQSLQSPFSKLPATPSLMDDAYNAPQPSSATSSLASVLVESEPSWSDHPPNKRRDTNVTKETTAECMKTLLLLWEFDRAMCGKLPTIHTPVPLSETKSSKDPTHAPMMAKAIFSKSKSLPPGNLSTAGSLGAGLKGRPAFPWLGRSQSDSAGKVCHSMAIRNPHDILALTDMIGRSNSYTGGVARYASRHQDVNKDVQYKGFASFQTNDQMKNEPDTLVLVPGKRPTTNCS